ncbi:hypothetical protein [Macrococcoides caseolyticum]|uniref:hypothetical protein n=1 Tax=Macrococcoides caseolyticum TaxID=69966 RepID=UPI000C33CD1D|nr:hypothetical protein [Macrococcus caseolyticus]MDJ1089457.1 hypothetical protein [Macrococcus caseolyticus]MDJ1153594.1 hypothetical protein [Macrococcus caseolyticus]PKE10720.1 hypothetical protein CW685_09230 [Macrococcus caseolyticus]PKE47136.1 hypothetical protein CW677_09440 [Macrococcus caseolyticus]PKF13882.1 hypothetical protein CW690_09435 [Macrococcus caseolyticus]
MKPLKRIIYCIRLIDNDGNEQPIYDVSYHYLIQVIGADESVTLDDSIYENVAYHPSTLRYLDVYTTDMIYPDDYDYGQYLYLARKDNIQLFYSKQIRTFKLSNIC